MLIEAIYKTLTLDFYWWFSLIINNLQYLFAFAVLMYLFLNGKKFVWATILLTMLLWLMVDVGNVWGWVTFVGGFLFIHYAIKIMVLGFVEDDPILGKKLILVNEFSGYAVWILFNLSVKGFL